MFDIMEVFRLHSVFGAALVIFSSVIIESHGCKVCGIYKLTSDPKDPALDEVLKAMGFSEATRKTMQESNDVKTQVTKNEAAYRVEIEAKKLGLKSYTFNSGQEFQMPLFDGRNVPAVCEVNEEERKLTYTFQFPDFEAKQVVEHKGKNMMYTLEVKDKKAVIQFVEIEGSEKAKGNNLMEKLNSLNAKRGKDKDDKDKKGTRTSIALLPISAEV